MAWVSGTVKGSECDDEKGKYTDVEGHPLPVYKLEVTTTEECHLTQAGPWAEEHGG